jgi:hypothetical protein
MARPPKPHHDQVLLRARSRSLQELVTIGRKGLPLRAGEIFEGALKSNRPCCFNQAEDAATHVSRHTRGGRRAVRP